jgi:hypothetical protein
VAIKEAKRDFMIFIFKIGTTEDEILTECNNHTSQPMLVLIANSKHNQYLMKFDNK